MIQTECQWCDAVGLQYADCVDLGLYVHVCFCLRVGRRPAPFPPRRTSFVPGRSLFRRLGSEAAVFFFVEKSIDYTCAGSTLGPAVFSLQFMVQR